MKNKVVKRILAGTLVAALTIGGVGIYNHTQDNNAEVVKADDDTEKLKEKTEELLGDTTEAKDGEFFKEETVYVNADATGKASQITVSEWLKNPGSGEVSDVTTLEDVQNIKGDETFEENGADEITWNAEGKDIYYQGTTEEELPVQVSIDYSLDGKSISPEDLVGKSGQLEMTISYENTTLQTVDGEEMYTPFTVASAMMLSTDEFQNVTIDNGKIISDADKDIVIGIAFPGLTEDLGISDLDMEIPESITITADVKDATVPTTLTMVDGNILSSFDLDSIDSFDDLSSSIDQLKDATNQLVEGSKELADGAKTLQDGIDAYTGGVAELAEGSAALYSGSKDLVDGVDTASDGISQLKNGSDQLVAGFEGNGTASNPGATAVSKSVANGLSQLSEALESETSVTLTDAQKAQLSAVATQMAQGAASALGDSAFAALDAAQGYPEGTTKSSYISGLTESYYQTLLSVAKSTAEGAVTNTKSTVKQSVDQLSAGATALSTQYLPAMYEGATGIQGGLSQLNSKTGELVEGTKTVYESIGKIAAGAAKLNENSSLLSTGSDKLTDGAGTLADGMEEYKTSAIDKLTDLFDGDISKVTDRIQTMKDLGDAYTSFAGKSSEINGSTRFIIETEGLD